MTGKRPASIAAYIAAAPREGQPHLRQLYSILRKAAPKSEAVMKWNTPFFIEPRFLFAFAANKGHVGFLATTDDLKPFEKELQGYTVTPRGIVHLRYDAPLPAKLIWRIAVQRLRSVQNRKSKSFW
jgi:uncharacterized protein YdhG (YjbR/CyaY superfamily)